MNERERETERENMSRGTDCLIADLGVEEYFIERKPSIFYKD